MCATFSDDDVGKPVENDLGEEVGVVVAIEGAVAHVRPDPAVVGSIKSSLGWDRAAEETRTLDRASVRVITDDAIRLEGTLPDRTDSTAEARSERDEFADGGSGGELTGEVDGTGTTRDVTDADGEER